MPLDDTTTESFSGFVAEVEGRLRRALTPSLGSEFAREAAAEGLAHGWENWDRVGAMENPAGYLYRVALNWGRSNAPKRPVMLPRPPAHQTPWIEPGLPEALSALSEKQRVAVFLVWGHEWSLAEVADLLGVAKGTVQKHLERGMKKLRRHLGVEQ